MPLSLIARAKRSLLLQLAVRHSPLVRAPAAIVSRGAECAALSSMTSTGQPVISQGDAVIA
jgi:hypothetical protein